VASASVTTPCLAGKYFSDMETEFSMFIAGKLEYINDNILVHTHTHMCLYLLVPNKPQQLSIGEASQVTHSNRKRWRYTVTWQVILII